MKYKSFYWPLGIVTVPIAITAIISHLLIWFCFPFTHYFVCEILVRQVTHGLILCWTRHWWGAGPDLKHLVSQGQWDTPWAKHHVGLAPTCSAVRTESLWGHCNSQANQSKPIYEHLQHNVFLKAAKTNSECFLMPRFAVGKILIYTVQSLSLAGFYFTGAAELNFCLHYLRNSEPTPKWQLKSLMRTSLQVSSQLKI